MRSRGDALQRLAHRRRDAAQRPEPGLVLAELGQSRQLAMHQEMGDLLELAGLRDVEDVVRKLERHTERSAVLRDRRHDFGGGARQPRTKMARCRDQRSSLPSDHIEIVRRRRAAIDEVMGIAAARRIAATHPCDKHLLARVRDEHDLAVEHVDELVLDHVPVALRRLRTRLERREVDAELIEPDGISQPLALAALQRPGAEPGSAAAWVAAGALSDALDVAASVASWRDLPRVTRWLVAASAGGAALTGAAAALTARASSGSA